MTSKLLSKSLRQASKSRPLSCCICRDSGGARSFRVHSVVQPVHGSSFSSAAYYLDEELAPLVKLENARLGYPSRKFFTEPFQLHVHQPQTGGHALLGKNGSGKTLVSNALVSNGHDDFLHEGSFAADSKYHSTAHVSFESHEALLAEGGTTYKAIGTGNLNKAAQFLVVRFGLYPLLHRDVSTLSTGEIRKVLLVRALSHRPRLLVLDNAFDGLDVASRQSLKDLVSKTLMGFRPDILVQGVNAKATAHTQVLMITHRAEELVDEIETLTFFDDDRGLFTESREGRTGKQLLSLALDEGDQQIEKLFDSNAYDTELPSVEQVAKWWQCERNEGWKNGAVSSSPLIKAQHLNVRRGEATLLHDLNWTVQKGERWLIAGKNGSGKSTLSRLLARDEEGVEEGQLVVSTGGVKRFAGKRREGVGWVSTELHMELAQSTKTTREVLTNDGSSVPSGVVASVAKWFKLEDPAVLASPFAELSQGQQKMVLIAAALASRPQVLVLDEPCQGLDLVNRRRVLGLVERVCLATDMNLIYITHHLEETLPSIGHVLHLTKGEPVYNGNREDYDPDSIAKEEDQRN